MTGRIPIALFLLLGCTDHRAAGTLDTLEPLVAKMCACQDKACGDAVAAEYQAWFAKNNNDASALDNEQSKRFQDMGTKMESCRAKTGGPSYLTAEPPVAPASGSAGGSGGSAVVDQNTRSDCAAAANHLVAFQTNRGDKQKSSAAITASCEKTKWTGAAAACVKALKTLDDAPSCMRLMTV